MATYNVQEIHDGRRCVVENGVAGDYVRAWKVVSSTRYSGPRGVVLGWIGATGLTIGSAYGFSYGGYSESDPNSRINKITPTQDSTDPCMWIVTAEYTSKWDQNPPTSAPPIDQPTGGGAGGTDPVAGRPVTIDYDQYEVEVAAERDRNGELVCNSAGEQFEPPLMKKKYIRVINIVKNKATFNDNLESLYGNRCNNADFTIGGKTYPQYTLRISAMPTGKQQHENGISFYAISYRLEEDPEGWLITRALDEGYHYWGNVTTTTHTVSPSPSPSASPSPTTTTTRTTTALIRFADTAGNPTPKPMLLDGEGFPLNNLGIEMSGGDSAYFIPFQFCTPLDFTTVGML